METHRLQSTQSAKELDQFFTKPEVAKLCIDLIPKEFDNYVWMEPCAGRKGFSDNFRSKQQILMDLDPKYPDIIQQDFLQYTHTTKDKVCIVTNPPFGANYRLVVEFFNKAAEFADVICHLVPTAFEFYTAQRRLNPDFKLLSSTRVRDNAFTFEGKDYPLRTCFQVWVRNGNINKRLVTRPVEKQSTDFTLYANGSNQKVRKTAHKNTDKYTHAIPWLDVTRPILTPEQMSEKDVCTAYWLINANKDIDAKLANLNLSLISSLGPCNMPGIRWNDFIDYYNNQFTQWKI